MSSYNSQQYYSPNGRPSYPTGDTYPRHGVQVQVPRMSPVQLQLANGPAVKTRYQTLPLHNGYQFGTSMRTTAVGIVAEVTPHMASMNSHAQLPAKQCVARALEPSTDNPTLLLALAEEYITSAYGKPTGGELIERETDINLYYKLISTGLGCLNIALRQGRLPPDLEARTRLRYASLLYQETDNYMEAEEVLSQGIALCERHRLRDLKYNMQHLLTHVMFTTNSKASLKFLDSVIKDVEAYRHTAWVYAFRFLRASLSLRMPFAQEGFMATNQFQIITSLADSKGDSIISATASIMEAMTHVRRLNNTENIEKAQRALAVARSSQLSSLFQRIPQLASMMHFVDISCSLQQLDPPQATSKMQAMHTMLDASAESANWKTGDGSFLVPLSDRTPETSHEGSISTGALQTDSTGATCVRLDWLPKPEIYALGYLLSGAVVMPRNTMDGQKSEQYLKEAKRMMSEDMPSFQTGSLSISEPRLIWRRTLLCQVQIYLIFALCMRSSWPVAKEELSKLKKLAADLPASQLEPISIFTHYLEGLVHQATGDLNLALTIFQSSIFALPASSTTHAIPAIVQPHRDLSILAALNTLLIIRYPTHPKHTLFPSLLSRLEAFATTNPSKNIQSAYHLLRATAPPTSNNVAASGIVKTKQYLQSALQAAKQCANNQLMCITLNFMSWKFFRGVVGEQAEKSAKASVSLAKKGRDTLWMSVAHGVLADTLECQGKGEEAEMVRREGWEVAAKLPAFMQREADESRWGD